MIFNIPDTYPCLQALGHASDSSLMQKMERIQLRDDDAAAQRPLVGFYRKQHVIEC